MSAVADIFDRDGDGYIDYYEFVAALHPNKDAYKPLTDADKIEDEVCLRFFFSFFFFSFKKNKILTKMLTFFRWHAKWQSASVLNVSKWSKLVRTNTG